jgi:hypothetical protein
MEFGWRKGDPTGSSCTFSDYSWLYFILRKCNLIKDVIEVILIKRSDDNVIYYYTNFTVYSLCHTSKLPYMGAQRIPHCRSGCGKHNFIQRSNKEIKT